MCHAPNGGTSSLVVAMCHPLNGEDFCLVIQGVELGFFFYNLETPLGLPKLINKGVSPM